MVLGNAVFTRRASRPFTINWSGFTGFDTVTIVQSARIELTTASPVLHHKIYSDVFFK
jgi:hypothetical protein